MEITYPLLQTVDATENVLFSDTIIRGNWSIVHRDGSGLVTIKGITTGPCRKARYRLSFSGNIQLPTGGTPGPISISIHLDGESLPETEMIVTPANAEEFFNVHSETLVEMSPATSSTISVTNTSGVAIQVQNANLIVERVA